MKKVKCAIWLLAALCLEIMLSPGMIHDYTDVQKDFSANDINQSFGYAIHDSQFMQESDDPNFVITYPFYRGRQVVLEFSEGLGADTYLQVFYAKKGRPFKEASSRRCIVPAGSTDCNVSLPAGDYENLRFDIDGSFSLEQVRVYACSRRMNYVKLVLYLGASALLLFVVWKKSRYFPEYYHNATGRIYDRGTKLGIRMEHCFLVLSLIAGIAFSFLVSPEQAPDEWGHYTMMVTEFGFPQYDEEIDAFYQNIDSRNIQRNVSKKQSMDLLRAHTDDRFSTSKKDFQGASIKLVSHLPAGIGFFTGVICHAPILVCMYLAELCSVVFYAVVGFFALKLMPLKKELLCGVMLLPMTVQQCSSVNYDAVLLPLCFLLTACCVNAVYGKKTIGWRSLAVFGGISLYIALIKPPYVLLLLLLFLVPKEKWRLKIGERFDALLYISKYKWFFLAGGLLLFCLAGYVFRDTAYAKLIFACLLDFPQYIKIIINTLRANLLFYMGSTIAMFGWLDTRVPFQMYAMVVFALFLFSQSRFSVPKTERNIKKRDRVVFFTAGILILLLIITILITWSFQLAEFDLNVGIQEMVGYLNQTSTSLGVQGRYFIPVVFLFLFPFHGILRIDKKELMLVQAVYYPVLFVWCARILLYRYWL